MKTETMIYVYIAICISMILFNCVYVFILRRNSKRLEKDFEKYEELVREQISLINDGEKVGEKHKRLLERQLSNTSKLTAFDNCLDKLYAEMPDDVREYLLQIYPVLIYLSMEYQGKDITKAAYFPYIISKYNILQYKEDDLAILTNMFDLLYSDNVYCRENALRAIYSKGDCEYVLKALRVIDQNSSFHHPKLVCDGLMRFNGDKNELGGMLWKSMGQFSTEMQVNLLNYMRFAEVRNDEKMLEILMDEKADDELRYSCIRYFEKYPCEEAKKQLQTFAIGSEELPWEYQTIASSALKSYPCAETERILITNLSSSNWYVRLNSAISCEKLNMSYSDLIQVFDGNDRYAREMIRYRLDLREAMQAAQQEKG